MPRRLSFDEPETSATPAPTQTVNFDRPSKAVAPSFDKVAETAAPSFDKAAQATPAPSLEKPNKISLDKKGQSINLSKDTKGGLSINLNWSHQAPAKKGFWAAVTGSGQADLDIGVLFEMNDGEVGVIQALGDDFGSYNSWPYIELDGDDRTGSNTAGETIRINADHWNEIERLMVYAYIYEGAPNWDATDGVVTVTAAGEPPIEIRMTNGRNDKTLCGVVLIENIGGEIKITREVEYYKDQEKLDRAHGWGINWGYGSK